VACGPKRDLQACHVGRTNRYGRLESLAERVIQLRLPSVRSLWFVAHDKTLHARMVEAVEFYSGASDEAAMRGHYLARSFWYTARLKEEVDKFALTSVELPPRAPVHEIVEMCLEQLRR
jgi:hypothetical protein